MRVGCCEDCQHWTRLDLNADPERFALFTRIDKPGGSRWIWNEQASRYGCCKRLSDCSGPLIIDAGDIGSVYTPTDWGCVEFTLRG